MMRNTMQASEAPKGANERSLVIGGRYYIEPRRGSIMVMTR